MNNAIYITTSQAYSGKSIITLGLMNILMGKTKKVAYFKPIINEHPSIKVDNHIAMIKTHFGLVTNDADMFAFTKEEVLKLRADGNTAYIIDTIIQKYKKLEETNDFVIVEGTDFLTEGVSFEFDANVAIAKNLGTPVILVVNGEQLNNEEIVTTTLSNLKSFNDRDVPVIAVVANKVAAETALLLKNKLQNELPKTIISSVIPVNKDLGNPTMKEIAENIEAKVLFGEKRLSNQVDKYIVGAMQLRNLLTRLENNTLIVTPGDRGDIILAALQADASKNYPKVAGLILTGGLEPEDSIKQLIDGLEGVVPILQVESGTFETVTMVAATPSRIYADNKRKIALALNTFEQFIDVQQIENQIRSFQTDGITPRMFQYQLIKRAKAVRKHIVLPEGNDDRILIAAANLVKQDIVDLTILGKKEHIEQSVKRLNLDFDLNKVQILYPVDAPLYQQYVDTLYQLRKNKNVTPEVARDQMSDVSYFGTMMVYLGHADGMVSGAVHTTQHTIRPALQFVKTKPGVSTVSSVFFMCLDDRVSVFGDCAVNPNPTSEQLAEIAISSAESSLMFGIEPKIAMLSYSSGASGQGEDVEKVRKATEIVKTLRPDLKVEGPIQYDAAVDPIVGKQKMPNSDVAGQASVLIFPDLNTGNNTYKAVQRETGALAIGPMLQGLNKPVNDLSRGCTVDDVFNTVIITAIQAQQA